MQQLRLASILYDAMSDVPKSSLTSMNPSSTDRSIERVINYLVDGYDQSHSLAELTTMVDWSPSYLSRRFAHTVGIGPIEYLNRIRIEKACRLLTDTALSITEVASAVGYNEIPYFNRRFKATVGVTPTAFRLGKTKGQTISA